MVSSEFEAGVNRGDKMKTCYVSIQYGTKPIPDGSAFDFEALYHDLIKPTVEGAGLACSRADELRESANILKAALSAAMNSDVLIADVSSQNPDVLYELGIRHAANSGCSIVIYKGGTRLPFNISGNYALPYSATGPQLTPDEAKAFRSNLTRVLDESRDKPGRYRSPVHDFFPELHVDRPREPCIFIGHGRSKLWARLQLFLQNEMGLKTIAYESDSHVGESIVPILGSMLRQATFAILILTAEDETAEGAKRARQNVVHEAGLFQGQLGFPRAILLKQSSVEDFSNVAGLQYIPFDNENIEATFWELQRVLKREGLVR